jgi:hypothetical protein
MIHSSLASMSMSELFHSSYADVMATMMDYVDVDGIGIQFCSRFPSSLYSLLSYWISVVVTRGVEFGFFVRIALRQTHNLI